MRLSAIYAHLNCSELVRSSAWFTSLFEREADARPMTGLAEWHHGENAGFQLFQNQDYAGKGTLTLIVEDIAAEHARLSAIGLQPGTIEKADYTQIVRLRDPDDNLVVLAQPRVIN